MSVIGAQVQSIIATGTSGTIIDIECHLSNNLPNIIIVGFGNRAVVEAKERIRGAFATSHIMLPRKRITVNLAPADIPKADSGFDLAIAVAILLASQQIPISLSKQQAFIGELGLDGSTRAVRGIIGKLLLGRSKGITTFYIPSANLQQAQLVPEVTLVPVDSVLQLYNHLTGTTEILLVRTGNGKYDSRLAKTLKTEVELSEVVGQIQAKRALEIAAAGGHNVFFSGPPGTGKSMLAKTLPSLMPPLNREEVLEVTHLHSLASHDYEHLVVNRPFRAPHHSASLAAITGGGLNLRPGEISLAHRGILFLDELPEFTSEALEALRQPLENHVISVARAHGSAEYPANFTLVATANPCPCGYSGSSKACKCTEAQKLHYRNKLSGPILDRIDLNCNVHKIDHDQLLLQPVLQQVNAADAATRQRIIRARAAQAKRFAGASKLNTDMTNAEVKKHAKLEPFAIKILNIGARKYNLSARAYMRTVKVARTIADLEGSVKIIGPNIIEALAYRIGTKDDLQLKKDKKS
jgi:magnesium chelatase family protein